MLREQHAHLGIIQYVMGYRIADDGLQGSPYRLLVLRPVRQGSEPRLELMLVDAQAYGILAVMVYHLYTQQVVRLLAQLPQFVQVVLQLPRLQHVFQQLDDVD